MFILLFSGSLIKLAITAILWSMSAWQVFWLRKPQPDFWEHLGQWSRKGPASRLCSVLPESTCWPGGVVISRAMWRIRRKFKLKGVIYPTLLGLTNSTLICIMPPLLSRIHRRQLMKSLGEKHSISMLPTIRHRGNRGKLAYCSWKCVMFWFLIWLW